MCPSFETLSKNPEMFKEFLGLAFQKSAPLPSAVPAKNVSPSFESPFQNPEMFEEFLGLALPMSSRLRYRLPYLMAD